MPRTIAVRLSSILSLVAILGLSTAPESAGAAATLLGKRAPGFMQKDQTAKDVDLASFAGKVVLVNFWATWCGPCKVEIPWFVEFEREYGSKGFVVLGVSMDADGESAQARSEAWSVVRPYLQEKRVTYRVVMGDESLAKLYDVESLPASFVLDRAGKIVAVHRGLVSRQAYVSDIEKAVNRR